MKLAALDKNGKNASRTPAFLLRLASKGNIASEDEAELDKITDTIVSQIITSAQRPGTPAGPSALT